jgi:hypothetical protein
LKGFCLVLAAVPISFHILTALSLVRELVSLVYICC